MTETKKAIYEEIRKIPKEKLGAFLKVARSFNGKVKSKEKPNKTLGLFADDTEFIDKLVSDAMKARENTTLRIEDSE